MRIPVVNKENRPLMPTASATRHGFRKGDLVNSPKGIGYVSGDTEKQISQFGLNFIGISKILDEIAIT